MKTFRISNRSRNYKASKAKQREVWMARVARMNAARERKRLAAAAEKPPRTSFAGRHCYTLTLHDRTANSMHTVDLYVSARRINAYRVTVDGKPWKDSISMTRVLAAIRRKLPPYRQLQ
jgi:hypothetical protein